MTRERVLGFIMLVFLMGSIPLLRLLSDRVFAPFLENSGAITDGETVIPIIYLLSLAAFFFIMFLFMVHGKKVLDCMSWFLLKISSWRSK
jgi:hypothetical protein